jgi:hypothetical protein
MKKQSEKLLERKLREKVKKAGGMALKLESPYFTGLPDRFILMPGGRLLFVELKSTYRKPTERQKLVMTALQKLGFSVDVVDSDITLNEFLNKIAHEI